MIINKKLLITATFYFAKFIECDIILNVGD